MISISTAPPSNSSHSLIELRKTKSKNKWMHFDKNSSLTSSRSLPMLNHSKRTIHTAWRPQNRSNWTVWLLLSERGARVTWRARLLTVKSRRKINGKGLSKGLSVRGSKMKNGKSGESKRRSGRPRRGRETD
jgi:hypothetical protein